MFDFIDYILMNINSLDLNEGESSSKIKYLDTGKISKDVFKMFLTGDPTPQKKYLDWMIKTYIKKSERPEHMVDMIKIFDDVVKRKKIEKTDIYSYDSIDELETQIETVGLKKSKGEIIRKIKSEEIEIPFEDERIKVVVPLSYEAAKLYGAHTKWCTSAKESDYWDSYYKDGIKIYYILDKKTNKKYAITASLIGQKKVFDEENNSISYDKFKTMLGLFEKDFDSIFQPASKEELDQRKEKIIPYILKIGECFQNSDGSYSCNLDVDLSGLHLIKLPVKFKGVGGNFYCNNNELTSLEGAPEKVGGDFSCSSNKLTSLEGVPEKVDGSFGCGKNRLTSLRYAPKVVSNSFLCSNNQLTSLEGAPKEVGGYFNCSSNKLTSLEGAPKEVGGYFNVFNNKLTSLEGAPEKVGGVFDSKMNSVSVEELKKTVNREYLK